MTAFVTPKLRIIRGARRAVPPWSLELYEARIAAGLTQVEAAQHYGTNERTYRRWELGQGGDGRMLAGFLELVKRRAA